MQAQVPGNPYIGLWLRLVRFDPEIVSQLLETRKVVRIVVMRGTIHLVSADDCLRLRPLVQPVLDRELARTRSSARDRRAHRRATGARVRATGCSPGSRRPGRSSRAGSPRASPTVDAAALAVRLPNHLAVVQVPPRACGSQRSGRCRLPRSRGSGDRSSRTLRSTTWCCGTSARSDRPPSPTSRPGRGSPACARSSSAYGRGCEPSSTHAVGSCSTSPTRRGPIRRSPRGPVPPGVRQRPAVARRPDPLLTRHIGSGDRKRQADRPRHGPVRRSRPRDLAHRARRRSRSVRTRRQSLENHKQANRSTKKQPSIHRTKQQPSSSNR